MVSTSGNTPPLNPLKRFGSNKSKNKSPPQATDRRRSVSSPNLQPPFISIEDSTQPSTVAEDHPGSGSGSGTGQSSEERSGSTFASRSTPEDQQDKTNGQDPRGRQGSGWQHIHRKRTPNIGWKKRWDEYHNAFPDGRVLIVDCYSRDFSDDGKRKTAAYEFADLNELRDFYHSEKGRGDHCLRLVHAQNAVWARDWLLKKYNIASKQEDVVSTGFGRWVKYDNPRLRAGKPVLNAKSFHCIRDPWRGVSRTGFGVDYLKSYRHNVIRADSEPALKGFKMMDLNYWDDRTESVPIHTHDVYVQRLSVYIQRNEGQINLNPLDAGMANPYIDLAYETKRDRAKRKEVIRLAADDSDEAMHNDEHEDEKPKPGPNKNFMNPTPWGPPDDWEAKVFEKLTSLDNGNTMIVFENSHTGRPSDTLIQAREEIEVRWRRSMLYLNRDEQSEDQLAMDVMDLVLRDLFRALQQNWERVLSQCEAHVSILEDAVYENPADETRAPELWANSALWLKLEKLISLHEVTITDLQGQMRELSESEEFTKEDWFKDAPADFARVARLFDDEMIKPTQNLSDLLYKSVEIRDSRHNLQLGTSMWRLSWITFIFLPLTFISGFFGMNVDIFSPPDEPLPSLKWYFFAAVPLMILIVLAYLIIKNSFSQSHGMPVQRGVYEQIYNQFARDHPFLWSRVGPRSYVKPRGWLGRLKWRIVRRWFDPKRTIARKSLPEIEDMGFLARIKRRLAQRWLRQIEHAPGSGVDIEMAGSEEGEFATVAELLQTATAVGMASPAPSLLDAPGSPPLERMISPEMGHRPLSPGSDMVVEEKSDDDESGREYEEKRKELKRKKEEKSKRPVMGGGDATSGEEHRRVSSDPSHFSTSFLSVPFGSKQRIETDDLPA